MGQNIWQNYGMFGTFWYMHAQEKYTLQWEKCNHILALSQLKKNKENTQ